MDTHAMALRALEDAQPSKRQTWLSDMGILHQSVRLDVPLHQAQEVLHALRWLAEEIPNICARIERETEETRRLFVAQSELYAVRHKIGRKKRG